MTWHNANWGRHGRGCAHCEDGVSVAWFASRAGTFGLCAGCVLAWWPSKGAAWVEERMGAYRDHVDDRLVTALQRQGFDPVVHDMKRQTIRRPAFGDRHPERSNT